MPVVCWRWLVWKRWIWWKWLLNHRWYAVFVWRPQKINPVWQTLNDGRYNDSGCTHNYCYHLKFLAARPSLHHHTHHTTDILHTTTNQPIATGCQRTLAILCTRPRGDLYRAVSLGSLVALAIASSRSPH